MAGQIASLNVDVKKFERALTLAVQHSSRSLQEVVNGQMIYLCARAIRFTKKAARADIEKLNTRAVVAQQFRGKRGQRLKKPRNIYSTRRTFADNIIIARYRRRGQPIPGEEIIRQQAKKMIASRMRSIAFIKSGWIPAIQTLIGWKRALRGGNAPNTNQRDGAKIYGKNKGYGIPAKLNLFGKMTSIAGNQALVPRNKFGDWDRPGNPEFYARQGLEKAVVATTADILHHLLKKFRALNNSGGIRQVLNA